MRSNPFGLPPPPRECAFAAGVERREPLDFCLNQYLSHSPAGRVVNVPLALALKGGSAWIGGAAAKAVDYKAVSAPGVDEAELTEMKVLQLEEGDAGPQVREKESIFVIVRLCLCPSLSVLAPGVDKAELTEMKVLQPEEGDAGRRPSLSALSLSVFDFVHPCPSLSSSVCIFVFLRFCY